MNRNIWEVSASLRKNPNRLFFNEVLLKKLRVYVDLEKSKMLLVWVNKNKKIVEYTNLASFFIKEDTSLDEVFEILYFEVFCHYGNRFFDIENISEDYPPKIKFVAQDYF